MKKLIIFLLLCFLPIYANATEMIVVYFSEAGAAKTGLSPTIDITDVADGSLDVDDGAMTELANGWYKYSFSNDATKSYTWLADGSASLCDPERYIEGNIYITIEKINAQADSALSDYDPPTRAEATTDKESIITEVNANETKIDTVDGVVDAIKLQTNNLPADPADDSDIDAQLLVINNYVDSLETRLSAARAGYLDELAAANIPTDLINIATALAALDPATSEEVATAIRFITSFEALLAAEDDAYVGDEGREIIVDCGTDLSLAGVVRFDVKTPSTTTTWTPAVYNSNYLKYTTVVGDLDEEGRYYIQAYIELGTFKGHIKTGVMNVKALWRR